MTNFRSIRNNGNVCVTRHPGQCERLGPVPGAREVQGHAVPALLEVGPSWQGQLNNFKLILIIN